VNAFANGRSKTSPDLSNLCYAINDGNTHSIETVMEVWSRLKYAKSEAQAREVLMDLGKIFERGDLPWIKK
jgi:hypothetical protein